MKSGRVTPFGYIQGPYYIYEINRPADRDGAGWEVIYVGRGKGRRALAYYRLREGSGVNRYHVPKGHNLGLDATIAAVRQSGREIGIFAYDHGDSLDAAKRHEKELIQTHGRRDLGRGTLFNRNWGG